MRFPLQCVAHLKLLTFHSTTALQRKLSCRAIARKGVGGLCGGASAPPMSVSLFYCSVPSISVLRFEIALKSQASFLGKHIVQVGRSFSVKSRFGVLQLLVQL